VTALPDWRVEQIRLTLFSARDYRSPPPTWWRDLTGQEPASQTIQSGIGVQHVGPFRDNYCQLVLDVKPSRVDWLMTSEVNPGAGFPSFDTWHGGAARFRELLLRWAPGIESVYRLAVGAILVYGVNNRVAGYEALRELLPDLRIDPVRSSDLIYQINRHAESRVIPSLRINRLSNWSVAQFHIIEIRPGAAVPTIGASPVGQPHAIRVQLDMNTDAERVDVFDSGSIAAVIDELLQFADRIAELGDRP